ncbi:MAG TPA: SPOR domain-containing protein [Desulfobacterales bacterium]|nr:SPOR domain-containing protein [Desulfobacterales bacterium]
MGIYVAQQGETLFSISGSEEVYSHPLKWPLLLWSNLAILDVMPGKGALEHKELPVGTKLRFFTREERKDNLKTLGNKRWVVNMVSDKNTKGMSRLVVKLAKARIPAYITMSKINGEIWFRLRCGFFESPFEAKEMKKRIEEVTGLRDLWLSKVSQQEFEAYGGLIGQRSY